VSERSPVIVGRVLVVVAAFGACAIAPLLPSDARACRFAPSPDHEIVADPGDTTPPSAPSAVVDEVTRGSSGGCWGGSSSCDDFASITLDVHAADETSLRDEIGFLVTVVEGELPEHASPSSRALQAPEPGRYIIHWVETDAPAFFARLSVSAVDRAGNVSDPTFVEVSDGAFEGCTVVFGMRGTLALAPLGIVIALLFFGRSRSTRNARRSR
jgi:hypothetical protein